jgi:hypothetical protein
VQGTLLLAILTVKSSYTGEVERPLDGPDDVPDTLQWWIGEQTWRIRTYALDHDIHTHSVARTGPEVLELAKQNNAKHYAEVTAAQHVLHFRDCADPDDAATVLGAAGLDNRLEVAAGRFAFWKPDDTRYRTRSRPK